MIIIIIVFFSSLHFCLFAWLFFKCWYVLFTQAKKNKKRTTYRSRHTILSSIPRRMMKMKKKNNIINGLLYGPCRARARIRSRVILVFFFCSDIISLSYCQFVHAHTTLYEHSVVFYFIFLFFV